jgi:hypothetical protein
VRQEGHGTPVDRLRAELHRLGLAFSVDEDAAVAETLRRLPEPAPAAFAAAVAERLVRRVENQALDDSGARRWRQLLNAVWEVLGGGDGLLPLVRREVEAMERWVDSDDEEVNADFADADLDHVAATLYAAQALLRGSPKAAAAAGIRGTAAADAIAQEQLPQELREPLTEEMWLASHPLVQAEVARQRTDLTLLAHRGVDSAVLAALRAQ